YNVYNTKFEKYIKNQIGRKKVSKVTPDNILDFYNSLYNAEKDALNIETIKVIDRLIKPSLQMAVDKGIIRSNPARGAIGRLKHKRSVLSNEADSSDEKARALEDEQLERLLEYVGDRYCYLYYYPLFYLLAWTGCRINEMLALTWYDVDFDEEIIHIRRSLSYQKVDGKRCFTLEKPKTKAGIREIPMLANVKKILSDLKEQNDDFKTPVSHNERVSLDDLSPFVFTNRYGNLIHYGSVDRKLHEIIDRYNLQHEDPLPQISCHGFRHTFTCWLCENAEKSTPMETIKYIQSILGHADASVTMNIYAECRRKKRNENHEMLKQKAAL
ncbi:MAG: site-specific integrase, partial [Lachnospiraceae bacterium]|nr:site-specific integrase [Lachnospiraceae bacterium]